MYSHPTLLSGHAFQANTFGMGAPRRVRTKSIVATSLRVRRLRGPALRNGIRAITSLPVSKPRRKTRLNVPIFKLWEEWFRYHRAKLPSPITDISVHFERPAAFAPILPRASMSKSRRLMVTSIRPSTFLRVYLIGIHTNVAIIQPAFIGTVHQHFRAGRICRVRCRWAKGMHHTQFFVLFEQRQEAFHPCMKTYRRLIRGAPKLTSYENNV